MAAPPYETLYGVQLLDDLHNYFPAILYDSSRFRTVPELLFYLQTATRGRFDLFSFGQRAYISANLPPSNAVNIPPVTAATPLNPHSSDYVPIRHRMRDDMEVIGMNQLLVELIRGMGTGTHITARASQATGQQFEDVPVLPTQQQINENTTRQHLSEESMCSICQDAMPINQMVRSLNFCGHSFHISCIDQWFSQNVHCPICRHDIRERAPVIDAPVTQEHESEEEES